MKMARSSWSVTMAELRKRRRKRKCRHCKELFLPHPGNCWHQRYCTAAACRQARQRASVKRWRRSKLARTLARRAADVKRVQQWRQKHQGYWKRKAPGEVALRNLVNPDFIGETPLLDEKSQAQSCGAEAAFQPAVSLVEIKKQADNLNHDVVALRDFVLDVLRGITSQLSGTALRNVVDPLLRNLTMRGQEIRLGRVQKGAAHASETSVVPGTLAPRPGEFQLGRPPSGAG
jgi:hypothetical protein